MATWGWAMSGVEGGVLDLSDKGSDASWERFSLNEALNGLTTASSSSGPKLLLSIVLNLFRAEKIYIANRF